MLVWEEPSQANGATQIAQYPKIQNLPHAQIARGQFRNLGSIFEFLGCATRLRDRKVTPYVALDGDSVGRINSLAIFLVCATRSSLGSLAN